MPTTNTEIFRKIIDKSISNELPMKAGMFAAKSLNGYQLKVLRSALQKYIRRGNLDKAIYVGIEMDTFAFIKGGEAIRTNLLNRLMIIALEDIGISNIATLMLVSKLYQKSKLLQIQIKKINPNHSTFAALRATSAQYICDIVTNLSNSEHGRYVSHYRQVFKAFADKATRSQATKLAKLVYPDTIFKLYQHIIKLEAILTVNVLTPNVILTQLTKALEMDNNFNYTAFYWACKLFEIVGHNGIFDSLRKLVKQNVKDIFDLLIQYHKSFCNDGDKQLPWMLFVIVLINVNNINWNNKTSECVDWQKSYNINLTGSKIEIDDYVYDRHVVGKTNKDARLMFLMEGSKVGNESPIILDNQFEVDFKNFYYDFRLFDEGESDILSKKYPHLDPIKLDDIVVIDQKQLSSDSDKIVTKKRICISKKQNNFSLQKELSSDSDNDSDSDSDSDKLITQQKLSSDSNGVVTKKHNPFSLQKKLSSDSDSNSDNVVTKKRTQISLKKELSSNSDNSRDSDNSSDSDNSIPKSKLILDKIDLVKESDIFEFRIRAQLVTGIAKTDSYYAYLKKTKKTVFVKGPFMDISGPENQATLSHIKKILGLAYLDIKVELLVPDLLAEPLRGIRSSSKIDLSKSYPFLIADDICLKAQPIPIIVKFYSGSTVPIEVVDHNKLVGDFTLSGDHIKKHLFLEDLDMLSIDLILNILYRYLFGIPDLAVRNFIVKNNKAIVSVDEDIVFRYELFSKGLPINAPYLIKKINVYLQSKRNMDKILENTNNWLSKLDEIDDHIKHLVNINKSGQNYGSIKKMIIDRCNLLTKGNSLIDIFK